MLRKALIVDGLKRGLHECVKSLAKASRATDGPIAVGGARLCVLASDCDEASYTKLIKALCAEKGVPLIEVATGKELGEWAGLCSIDAEGVARKVVNTSCCCIVDYGESSHELEVLLKHLSA